VTTPRRVLLLAATTGYQIRAFGEWAAHLGIDLVLASDRCTELDDPWADGAVPVRFHDLDTSVARVCAALADAPPAGVLAVGDGPVPLAARVAEAFGLPGNPPDAADASTNKLAARGAFLAAGLPAPHFDEIDVLDDLDDLEAAGCRLPAVIKPVSLSGSCGVMRADTPDELAAAAARLRRLLQGMAAGQAAHFAALVEDFIPGREYAVEGLLDHGTFRALAIFDKPDPLDGPYFEETIYVTPSRADETTRAAIVDMVARAVAALGLRHGPVHAECRVNEAGVFVLEAAARPIGGLCARALRFVRRGGDPTEPLEALLLRHAAGEDVSSWTREPSASGVMMIPVPRRGVLRGVSGVDAARAVPGITDVRITAKRDALLLPLPEGRSYPGFIFARTSGPAEAEAALRTAHACLAFDVDPEIPVL
jgi:hypothetical protein